MAKTKKISKTSKRRLALFGTLSIIIIFYFIFSSGYYIYKIYSLKQEEKQLSNKLYKLEKEEKDLSTNMEKLKDPDYLAKYAREAYSYSKDDEIIIQKYEDNKTEKKDKKFSFSKNDIIITSLCITILLIIIIYIIIKNKNSKKKKKKKKR